MPANCCTHTYDLGCIECGDQLITLPAVALMDGTYRALFRYLGRTIAFEFQGVTGEPLVVRASGLNERFVFVFHVLDPNGDQVSFGIFDCFSIRVIPCEVDGNEPDVDEDCDPATLIDEDDVVMASLEAGEAYTVVDEDGDPVTVTLVGSQLVITMPNPFHYEASLAAALANTTTVLTSKQMLVIEDTGAQYPSSSASTTPRARVLAKIHALGVIDAADTSEPILRTVLPEGEYEIQANPIL